jgi:LPS export ABC transporter protein LptC
MPPAARSPHPRIALRCVCCAAILAIGASAPASPEAEEGSVLRLRGMTFVGSRGPSGELVLQSERAIFHPDTDLAELEKVEAVWTDPPKGERFTVRCDAAELDVATNDFVARGNVRGETAEGQRYRAPLVRYDHAEGLLHSDRRVTLVDETGSFEGDGFRYLVREGSFSLLGNVRVVQTR